MKMFINGDNFGFDNNMNEFLNQFFGGEMNSNLTRQESAPRVELMDLFDKEMKVCFRNAINSVKEKGFEKIETHNLLVELLKIRPEVFENSGDVIEFLEANSIDLGTRYEGNMKIDELLIKDIEKALFYAQQDGRQVISIEDFWRAIKESGNDITDKTLKSFGVKDKHNISDDLKEFIENLNAKAQKGEIQTPIGRDEEITRVIQILSRKSKSNPILIGEPGVGKTAIAEGLAKLIFEKKVPKSLQDKTIYSLNLGNMLAGTKFRGEFEDRLKSLLKNLKANKNNIILFIDEIHTIVGAGATDGQLDIANMLKPALASGEISVIGATTLKEYRKYFEKDSALTRRFQPVNVDEPSVEQTIEILNGLKESLESHHGVKIEENAIVEAAVLSDKYINDRFLPDKAIDLIDEAASKVNLYVSVEDEGDGDLDKMEKQLEALVKEERYEEASGLRDKIQDWKDKNSDGAVVDGKIVRNVLAKWVKIPVESLSGDEKTKLLNLENILQDKVIGQNEAIKVVSEALRRAHAGVSNPNRPFGNFLFVGSTGVGKTELAKSLTETLFGGEDKMVRLDMSEYMEKHSVSKIIGSPPGYVGFDDGGGLTEKIRRQPYSVVLLDEIEKAHPEVLNAFLQVLEDGYIVDSKGNKISFKNCIIIATSNAGVEKLYDESVNDVYEALSGYFRPEFLNRFDEIVKFNKLSESELEKIVDIYLGELHNRLKEKGITVEMAEEAKEFVIADSESTEFGARPLRRSFMRLIENKIAEMILRDEIKESVKIGLENGELVFSA